MTLEVESGMEEKAKKLMSFSFFFLLRTVGFMLFFDNNAVYH